MSTQISDGVTPLTPSLVEGYVANSPARTLTHDTLSGRRVAVLLPAAPRQGTLRLYFEAQPDAQAGRAFMLRQRVFTLADPAVPIASMRFVVADGDLTVSLDEESDTDWFIDVPFKEVA
ncbi:hypothetical protein [Schumannella soli]|uniref:Uncharacterized protein n=1 Tax=Schumannella soli TaxID=2590779 RepID=A0A506Y683_9MICO|nr:hypothetical protein [Schumannella soli]TPW75899.1 hypothetical protein FJ657_08610 [Schumannella soli]